MPEKEVTMNIEQLLSLYQTQKSQLESLERQINSLNSILTENQMAYDALIELEKGQNDLILFSIGGGVYLEAKISDVKKLKANIGGNIIEEMPIKKAMEKLESRKKSVEENMVKLRRDESAMINSLLQMENIFKQMDMQKKQAMSKRKSTETDPNVV